MMMIDADEESCILKAFAVRWQEPFFCSANIKITREEEHNSNNINIMLMN